MAEQICPKCKNETVTWAIDEEESRFTRWHCRSCDFWAEEDESREYDCARCGTLRASLLLRYREKFYRWCYKCGSFENTDESF